MADTSYAADRVRGPAIALIVTAVLLAIWQVLALVATVFDLAVPEYGDQELPAVVQFATGTIGAAIGLGMAFLVGFGALKMQRLESYSLALAGSIVAMIPCSPCCLIGLPFGIWALVVLMDDRVKTAFR